MKLIYEFTYADREGAEKLKKTIEEAIKTLEYKNYTTSIDLYSQNAIFLVIHGIEDKSRAEGFEELLRNNKNYQVKKEPVLISSENYRIVLLHKNLEEYKKLNTKQ